MQDVRHGWRILFALGVIPSVLQLILMHWLPESPRVMILRGQEDLARETYKRIYSKATPEVIELKLRVAKLYVEATTQMQRGMTFWGRCKRLWTHKPYRRAIITVSGLQMFGQLTGFNTLLYYSGTLFGLFGFSNGAAAGLIPAGINALFVVCSQIDYTFRSRLTYVAHRYVDSGQGGTSSPCFNRTANHGHRYDLGNHLCILHDRSHRPFASGRGDIRQILGRFSHWSNRLLRCRIWYLLQSSRMVSIRILGSRDSSNGFSHRHHRRMDRQSHSIGGFPYPTGDPHTCRNIRFISRLHLKWIRLCLLLLP